VATGTTFSYQCSPLMIQLFFSLYFCNLFSVLKENLCSRAQSYNASFTQEKLTVKRVMKLDIDLFRYDTHFGGQSIVELCFHESSISISLRQWWLLFDRYAENLHQTCGYM